MRGDTGNRCQAYLKVQVLFRLYGYALMPRRILFALPRVRDFWPQNTSIKVTKNAVSPPINIRIHAQTRGPQSIPVRF